MAKPKCFFDIEIGGAAAGRVVIEVRRPEMVTTWRTWPPPLNTRISDRVHSF